MGVHGGGGLACPTLGLKKVCFLIRLFLGMFCRAPYLFPEHYFPERYIPNKQLS